MAPNALSHLTILAGVSYVVAQTTLTFPPTPLISQSFPKPTDAPYQVYPASQPYIRGPQTGYNQCNSTTEGDNSMCQTSYVNSLSDFCLWAPATSNSTISDTEGEEVAWCSQPGHGTRLMPAGTITGAQLLKNNDYWMITGLLDQTKVNIQDGDFGGELDSGGQDERGNPIGGLLYSTAFQSDASQISWWTEFIGSNQFCIKICNPNGNNDAGYCQHTLDRIGLSYNCPSKYTIGAGQQPGEFEMCETDDMTVPGIYVDSSGTTQSYSQPAESLGPITTIPYSVTTAAASSSCTTFASSELFSALGSASGSATASGSGSVAGVTGSSSSKSGSGAQPTTSSSGAGTIGFSLGTLVGVVAGAFVLLA